MSHSPLKSASAIRSGIPFGIALMLIGMFLFSVNDVMGKWLVATYSVGQVLLLRNLAALAVIIPVMRLQKVPLALPARPGLHALRILFATLDVTCFYWSVQYLSLADAMTFYMAGPIFVAVLAAILLNEKLDLPRALAVIVGFAGVIIVLRPTGSTFTLPALIALAGSISYALLIVTTRKLRDAPDATLVFGQTLGTLLLGLVAAPFGWVTPNAIDLAGLLLLGIVALIAHACVNRSLKIAPASVVVPYQYTLIVWAIVLGYIFFGDVVGSWTLVGVTVICTAGLVLLVLEREKAKRERKAEVPTDATVPEL